jgi:hypothetical protein
MQKRNLTRGGPARGKYTGCGNSIAHHSASRWGVGRGRGSPLRRRGGQRCGEMAAVGVCWRATPAGGCSHGSPEEGSGKGQRRWRRKGKRLFGGEALTEGFDDAAFMLRGDEPTQAVGGTAVGSYCLLSLLWVGRRKAGYSKSRAPAAASLLLADRCVCMVSPRVGAPACSCDGAGAHEEARSGIPGRRRCGGRHLRRENDAVEVARKHGAARRHLEEGPCCQREG